MSSGGGAVADGDVPELESLQEYFAARLPDRLRELEQAWLRVRNHGWSEATLKDFHRLAHSLVGAGATFGFPALTVAARALERQLLAVLRGGPPPAAAVVDDLIDWLRQAAGAPAGAPGRAT